MDEDDDLLAELEAELESAPDTGPDARADETSLATQAAMAAIPQSGVSTEEFIRLQIQRQRAEGTNNRSSRRSEMLGNMFRRGRSQSNASVSESPAPSVKAVPPAELEAKDKEIEKLKQRAQQLEEEVGLHKESKDQLLRQVKALQLDLDDQRRVYKRSMAAINEKNSSLQAEIKRLQQNNVHLLEEMAREETSSDHMKPTQGQTASDSAPGVANQPDSDATAQEEAEQRKGTVRECESTIKQLKATADQARTDLEVAQGDVAALRQEIVDLKLRADWATNNLEEARQDAGSARDAMRKAQQEIKALEKEVQRLRTALDKEQKAMADRLDTLTKAKSESQALASRLAELEQKHESVVAEKNSLVQHNSQLKTTLEDMRLQLDQTQRESLQEQQTKLQEQLAELEQALEDMTQAKAELALALEDERASATSEATYLTGQLNEELQQRQDMQQKLRDLEESLRLQQKKHAHTTRDMAKQLSQAQKKLASLSRQPEEDAQSVASTGSMVDEPLHSPSNSSIHSRDMNSMGGMGPTVSMLPATPEPLQPAPRTAEVSTAPSGLASLFGSRRAGEKGQPGQRLQAKVDFLESHVNELTESIKNKNKLLQQYFLREKMGHLASPSTGASQPQSSSASARFKALLGANLQQQHQQAVTQEAMAKLQEVLEDTMLQNIALKETIDALTKA
ncbi:uncharacterized protein MONBRDRAFT_36818 [Monosiga brevicollis MX1]|uniref:Uncharacterized protein n=1 Tax=Monosiga brevicollis TaxID=81824 RepID=A9UXZ1_MONBE|nr:uncharacterized protein MONBRDRAFT_36818 [Monosiga brevicollis MX1]EDQ89929.1 predicted protein [Monosiga brevicollis MX1]|eukprot:XP_001745351.1 hypothetical protein [Monosiga brevicollis MX1]